MIPSFEPRLDVLPASQQWLWPQLRGVSKLGLVLYGGTAIALRLGHRLSVDFDFFALDPLDEMRLLEGLPLLKEATVLQQAPDSYTYLIPGDRASEAYVKVSFFGDVDIGRVGEPAWTTDGVLQVAHLDDLMATKLKVLLQRVEAKDYQDIAAMLVAGVKLGKGLAAARALYGSQFQPSECLKALVYFEGGDLDTLDEHVRNTLVHAAAGVRDLPSVKRLSHDLAHRE